MASTPSSDAPSSKSKTRTKRTQFLSRLIPAGTSEAVPLLKWLNETCQIAPWNADYSASASVLKFAAVEDFAYAVFQPFGKSIPQRREIISRPCLSSQVELFENAVKGKLDMSETEKQIASNFAEDLGSNWTTMLQDSSERGYEERWGPAVERLISASLSRHSHFEIMVKKDREDILVPLDLCLFFSKPKPDFIVYLRQTGIFSSKDKIYQFPIFHIGGKGANGGIDSALPQDCAVSYAVGQSWLAAGIMIDEVAMLQVAVATGMIMQFFIAFWSDLEPIYHAEKCHASIDSLTESTPDLTTENEVKKTVNRVKLFQSKKTSTPEMPSNKFHRLITIPLTKKLDPADDAERMAIGRCFMLCGRHMETIRDGLQKAKMEKLLHKIQAGADPMEFNERDDEGFTKVECGETWGSSDTIAGEEREVDDDIYLMKQERAEIIGQGFAHIIHS